MSDTNTADSTANEITDDQIEALLRGAEGVAHNDVDLARSCTIALGYRDASASHRAFARAICAAAINSQAASVPAVHLRAVAALRTFALAYNEVAFARLVSDALNGEMWAIERVTEALDIIGERVDCDGHYPGPSDDPGKTAYCDGSCRPVRDIKLAVIIATDTARPEGDCRTTETP